MGSGVSAQLKELEQQPDKEVAVYRSLVTAYEAKKDAGLSDEELYTHMAAALERSVSEVASAPPEHGGPAKPSYRVPTRRFGRTEIQMPIITCGGMRMQQTWQPPEGMTIDDVTEECQANFQAIVDKAMELGINHFETARGYGCSELQYGRALKRHPRSSMIIQTKVRPFADQAEFRKTLEISLGYMDCEFIDLLSIHGINRPEHLEWVMKEGGCLEVLREYQQAGKIRFIGFSSHAPTSVIVKAINTGVFDYVNLHYHFIGSYTSSGTGSQTQGNLEALQAAAAHDMGIFIISPTDKGGMLWKPSKRMVEACAPLSPVAFNDLWLWMHQERPVHTLVVGAARPSDFDEHVAAAQLLSGFQDAKSKRRIGAELVREIAASLTRAWRETWGEWADDWWQGLPDCYQTPTGVHVAQIVWLWGVVKAYGLHSYAVTQYAKLEANRDLWNKALSFQENVLKVPFDWTPGLDYDGSEDPLHGAWRSPALAEERKARVLEILNEAHEWLGKYTHDEVDPELKEKGGWADAHNMQPDVPFPERK